MTIQYLKLFGWLAAALFFMQSLADIAREEAERRRVLDEQGVEEKIVDPAAVLSQPGNITVSTATNPASRKQPPEADTADSRKPLRSFSAALQKLDRTIRKTEERLHARRMRLQTGRRQTAGGFENSRVSGRSQDRLQEEIEDLERDLEALRRERSGIYKAGKKAGYLPGELDGKGIIP